MSDTEQPVAAAGSVIESVNPATEEVIGSFPDTTPTDLDAVVAAAKAAAPAWGQTPPTERAAILRKAAQRISESREALAQLDARDSGNPIVAMRRDVQKGIDTLEYFAGLATEAKGMTLPLTGQRIVHTRREPHGLVARIIPFNHPAQFAIAKVAAPLAAGNCVILKPGEQTSLSAIHLREILDGVLPAGVLNIVTGYGHTVGDHLVRHPAIPRVAFTGSVPVGEEIMRSAARHTKSVTLELGGKNPMIVFPDVDIDLASTAAIDSMNFRRSQGQSCGSTSRVFVHESIHDQFAEALTRKLKGILVGDPTDEKTEMGPLVSRVQYDKVARYVQMGVGEGARLVSGGHRPEGLQRGYFHEPTVFADVNMSMTIAREEIFGPVLSLFKWRDVDEVTECANDTPLGLTASVWTNNLTDAHAMAQRINAGYVWVNGRGGRPLGAPFGGFGDSGLGKENCLEELLSYTREKTVDITLPGRTSLDESR